VGVGDHQVHAAQASVFERTQEAGPERSVFGVADVETQDFPVPVGCRSGGDGYGARDDLLARLGDDGAKELFRMPECC